jgi:three-Cys-motif partner protein
MRRIKASSSIKMKHTFGGPWTSEKLESLRSYLEAYTQALSNQPFRLTYIDAFAGTGYVNPVTTAAEDRQLFLDDFKDESAERLISGSARIALDCRGFHDYIFIEKHPPFCRKLDELRRQYPDRTERIQIIQADSNETIRKICSNKGNCPGRYEK